ncbi:MAG: RIP metalloprotease RseP [Chloroflexi bacterium]|nr:MAG: RIP metalloprotease RseP [Chloroflexota bacterium]
MLLTIVSFLLLLGALMFFHELGHYLAARRNGIVVEEFGVFGFPPRIIKLFTYDGTLFSINAIPLGAFVRMKGEDAADMSPGSFNAASARARAVTLVAGPAMNFLIAIIFSVASVLSGFPASIAHPLLEDVPATSAAAAAGLQKGDILLSQAGDPLLVTATDGEPLGATSSRTLADGTTAPAEGLFVLRGGERLTLATSGRSAVELLAGVTYAPVLGTQVTAVVQDSPAAQAQLAAGDIVFAINDIPVTPGNSLGRQVSALAGNEVTLTVVRGDGWLQIPVLARKDPPAGQGSMGIAIDGVQRMVALPFHLAVVEGVRNIVGYVGMVVSLPVMLIAGQLAPSDAGFSGPVGIAQLVGGAVSATVDTGFWFPIWQLAAIISAGLAVANLFPIPALDGGRLLFIVFEKLRGRRLDPEKEGMIHLVGFALLLGLMVVITVSDIRSGPQAIDWLRILGQ